jgi:CRISPR-associated protein Cas1
MHRHLTLSEYGQYLGTSGECLVVKDQSGRQEFPLNRIKTIQVAKRGVSLSTDALLKCAAHGIRLFVCDFRNQIVASLSGNSQHAVVAVRKSQFQALNSMLAAELSAKVVYGKIRNQRATLLYFNKYHQHPRFVQVAQSLQEIASEIKRKVWVKYEAWREILLGMEGQAAARYWQVLAESGLLPDGFNGRIGRQATDATNKALNYGYAILTTYVWNAIINAGLEPYAGFLHSPRPGKPSLVLDLMEEYRAWVVDRTVIKLRGETETRGDLTPALKKKVIHGIHKTFATRYHYRGKRMRLESILQRNVYHLVGAFMQQKQYRPYTFRW